MSSVSFVFWIRNSQNKFKLERNNINELGVLNIGVHIMKFSLCRRRITFLVLLLLFILSAKNDEMLFFNYSTAKLNHQSALPKTNPKFIFNHIFVRVIYLRFSKCITSIEWNRIMSVTSIYDSLYISTVL